MSSLIRRLILPPVAAASLLAAAAGSALAGDPKVTVSGFNGDGTPAGATVCEFYVEFNPIAGGEEGSWELRDAGDAVVAEGSYSVTASTGHREPATGTWALPNGTYMLLWDNEDEVDNSRTELEIVVECTAPSQSVAAATDAPSPSMPAETDNKTPFQSVEGETDTPQRTQPDTAAFESTAQPDSSAWTALLAVILGVAAAVLVLTPRRGTSRR